MKIAIENDNLQKIQQIIDAKNGRAREHTIADAQRIIQLATRFEKKVESIVGAKSRMRGAQVTYTSGGQVCTSYKYSRYINRVIMRRGSQKWYLEGFERISVREGWARSTHIALTPVQNQEAVRNFQRQYTILSDSKCKSISNDTVKNQACELNSFESPSMKEQNSSNNLESQCKKFVKDLINEAQATEICSLKAGALRIWRSNGRYRLPFIEVASRVPYRKSELVKRLDYPRTRESDAT